MIKCEYSVLDFHRQNQVKYKDSYKAVMDFMTSRAAEQNKKVDFGRVSILPSFEGTERNRMKHYMDSLAITTEFGSATLLITMTANPHWKEVQENLPETPWYYKPQVVNRVFLQKNVCCSSTRNIINVLGS